MDSEFTVNFNFSHKYISSENISIPVRLKILYSEQSVRLNVQYDSFFSTGEFCLNDSIGQTKIINIFPYTGAAHYVLNNIETAKNEIYFKDELIDINGIYWRIDSFDYPSKKLWIDSVGVVEKPIGYRIGQYVDRILLERGLVNLRINQTEFDLSKEYTVLHFWGEWCHPCLKEMPRLKKLLHRVNNEKMNMIHVNFLVEKSNINNALGFISSSNMKGLHLIDDSMEEYSLVNMFRNTSFPNYIVVDKDFKIVYRGDEVDINLPTFLKSKGLL